jgi:hypothetical protein
MMAVANSGYGLSWAGGKAVSAHRVSWMAFRGPIPDGMCVLHTCDIRLCVNPDHLFLGTQSENMRDMRKKGRALDNRGEKHARAKLSNEAVIEIRNTPKTLGSGVSLAMRYGVTDGHISDIRRGRSRPQ